MHKKSIHFFSEKITFLLKNKSKIREWINLAVLNEKGSTGEINYIFCNDKYLYRLNNRYLEHNTYTDIITFDNSEDSTEVSGDIFISIDRVKENSKKYNVSFYNELHRVMIHGVLHLLNYKDKSDQEARIMRQKEDYYLSLLPKNLL
ncbi:MAG: rRNA maturation RNase YbeY [Bacteroidales bacterium]|nr:rRNA maturation RNase YbeY [Bacteroidales bacterium]